MQIIPPPHPRLEGRVDIVKLEPRIPRASKVRKPIVIASPYVWRDPATIPRRGWIYGRHYIRRFASVTVAPGGLGKSTLVLTELIAIATGRPLLGVQPAESVPVWYADLEDPREEIDRRVAAICQAFGLRAAELEGRLFITSGRETPIKIARPGRYGGPEFDGELIGSICDFVLRNGIGAACIDPFVASHSMPENDNTAIDAIAKQWAWIADATACAVQLVHHARKPAPGQTETTVDDARGAGALVNAARSARVLNRMTPHEAEQASVEDRRRYIRVDTGKSNLAPPEEATWFEIVPVSLANGDSVATIRPWRFPAALDGVTVDHLRRLRALAGAGSYRRDPRSPDWIGRPLAEMLGLDIGEKGQAARIKNILKAWFANGALTVEIRPDQQRKPREFVVPGVWDEEDDGAPV